VSTEGVACSDTTIGTTVEECVVNAENAAEQADCLTTPAAPSAAAQAAAAAVDECIVEAENAAEILACSDTTIGTTVEECVVNAENAAEQADCLAPVAAAEAPTTSMDQDNLECIVSAENAAEILDCEP